MDQLKGLGFKDVSYLMNPGIYVLCLKDEIIYIGQTINMLARFNGGDHRSRTYDKIYFIKCAISELDRLEALLILKLKPTQNRAFNFNSNNDYRNKPVYGSPGPATHTITVKGVQLTLSGRRRM